MKHIVIGMGEVGKAIFEVLSSCDEYEVGWHDIGHSHIPFASRTVAMHVSIPYTDNFVSIVKSYILLYRPSLVIVHSSVPVGTCDAEQWIHSPIRGVHPNLAKGIMTFVKYFGGIRSEEASDIFSRLGVKTVSLSHARHCEAAKLWDTTQYGLMIILSKVIHEWCKANNVDFEFVYRECNRSYNEGYRELGRKEVVRPFLKHMPGPIGGHCVIPNLPLLGKNEITDIIESYNQTLDLVMSGEIP